MYKCKIADCVTVIVGAMVQESATNALDDPTVCDAAPLSQ